MKRTAVFAALLCVFITASAFADEKLPNKVWRQDFRLGFRGTLIPVGGYTETLNTIGPSYSFNDGFSVSFGLGLVFDSSVTQNIGLGVQSNFLFLYYQAEAQTKLWTVGPLIRFSVPIGKTEMYLKLSPGFALGIMPDQLIAYNCTSPQPGWYIEAGVGIIYWIAKTVGVYLEPTYQYAAIYGKVKPLGTYDLTYNSSSNLFLINLGMMFKI